MVALVESHREAVAVDAEGYDKAGSYVIPFGDKYRGQELRWCGKDWLLWCLHKGFYKSKWPEFQNAATTYLEYLNDNPGKCTIEWKGRNSGRRIENCDIGYVEWFAYGHSFFLDDRFPEGCAAGRAWLASLRTQEDETPLVTIITLPLQPKPPIPVSNTPLVHERSNILPESREIRHYMANRDIGELTRKFWDEYEAEAGDEEEYEYDDFVVPDSDELDEELSDIPSEISACYPERRQIIRDTPEQTADEEDDGSAGASVDDAPQNPRKRKRVILSSDDDSELDKPTAVAPPATPRRKRTASTAVHLPTPLATPESRVSDPLASTSKHGAPKSHTKRRAVVESSGDENDSEPLSSRITRKRLSAPLSPKKAKMTKQVAPPSPTSSSWEEETELDSDIGDFIDFDDMPRRSRANRSPPRTRSNRFVRM